MRVQQCIGVGLDQRTLGIAAPVLMSAAVAIVPVCAAPLLASPPLPQPPCTARTIAIDRPTADESEQRSFGARRKQKRSANGNRNADRNGKSEKGEDDTGGAMRCAIHQTDDGQDTTQMTLTQLSSKLIGTWRQRAHGAHRRRQWHSPPIDPLAVLRSSYLACSRDPTALQLASVAAHAANRSGPAAPT